MRKGFVLAGALTGLVFLGVGDAEARGGSRGSRSHASPPSHSGGGGGSSRSVSGGHRSSGGISSRSFSSGFSERRASPGPVHRGSSGARSSGFSGGGRQGLPSGFEAPSRGRSLPAPVHFERRGAPSGGVSATSPGRGSVGSARELFGGARVGGPGGGAFDRLVRRGQGSGPVVAGPGTPGGGSPRGLLPAGSVSRGRSAGSPREDSPTGAARLGNRVFGARGPGGARAPAGGSVVAGSESVRTGAVTASPLGGRSRLPGVFGGSATRGGAVNTRVVGDSPGRAVTGGRVNVRSYRHGYGHHGYHDDGHHHYDHHHHHHHGWYDTWWGFGVGFTLGWASHWPGYYWAWGHPYSYYSAWYGGPCFGYAVSYYEPGYTEYFVEAVPYSPPTQVVLEQPVVVGPGAPQVVEEVEVVPEAAPPAAPGAFPEPAPEAPAQGAPPPLHADFDPGVKAFLAGNYAMAEGHFLRVVADEPDNGEAWLGLMQARLARGDYAASAEALARAAELGAFPRGYRFDPRPLYPQQGSYERVVKALDQHLKAHPKDADAWIVRAYLHVALAERGQAREAIDKVLALRPDDATAPELALALLPPLPPPQKPAPAK